MCPSSDLEEDVKESFTTSLGDLRDVAGHRVIFYVSVVISVPVFVDVKWVRHVVEGVVGTVHGREVARDVYGAV